MILLEYKMHKQDPCRYIHLYIGTTMSLLCGTGASFFEVNTSESCFQKPKWQSIARANRQMWLHQRDTKAWLVGPGEGTASTSKDHVWSLEVGKKQRKLRSHVTPPKFNIASEKWWFEDYFSYSEGNFSGAMLNFGRVSLPTRRHIQV